MKQALIFLIIAVVAVGIVGGIYFWQQSQKEKIIVRVAHTECLSCGCNIYIVEDEQNWSPGRQIALEVPISIAQECLSQHQRVENSLEEDYLLMVEELGELESCVKNREGIGYIKPDDIYSEWPMYYDQYVEFEGYVVYVYECGPCPLGAVCEPCFAPYFTVAQKPSTDTSRYYKTGQIVVKYILGEEVKQDHKYKVRGRMLPSEESFSVEIVGVTHNDYPVIEPTESAIEISD